MTHTGLDLVGLLYRADWTRVSLVAEVKTSRERDPSGGPFERDRLRSRPLRPLRLGPWSGPWTDETTVRLYPGGSQPPWWQGREWEVVTDSLRVDSSRSTLVIAPGGRYRHQEGDAISGCDGDRSWEAHAGESGWVVGAADPVTHPPLPVLLRPSWLLSGYTLEAGEPVTAGGRDALRVVATPRARLGDGDGRGLTPPDRIEVIVDTGLGILLRHEEIRDGRTVDLTELENLSVDPTQPAGDAQFAPPGGWEAVEENEEPASAGGPAWEVMKFAAGVAAGGLGALIRRRPGRAFEQATREEPEAQMPPEEPAPADGTPAGDEVLHLLHRSEDLWAPGLVATLHQWYDIAAILSRVPDGARQAGFGGLGSLIDVAGERMTSIHTVSRLRFAGPLTYRIDADHSEGRPITVVCDGERRWRLHDDDRVTAGPAGPPPAKVADLLSSSWLLELDLSGGSQAEVSGRRGYRLHVAADDLPWPSPAGAVIDAALGIVLRWTSYLGPAPVARYELRDVAVEPGEPGDFRFDIPPGAQVSEEPDPAKEAPRPASLPGVVTSEIARLARWLSPGRA